MAFSKFQLTTAGTELLNRVLAENKTLTFTKFEIGDGNYTGDVKQLTNLVSKFKEFNVLDTNIVNSQVNIRAFLDNSDLEEEKYLREIGVFARIGDEVLTEVIFSYSNSGDTAELIPDKSEYFSRTLSIYSFIGDVQSVTFSVDLKIEKTDFNTKEELRITNLEIGSKVNLWGSNELGDTYKTSYIITSEVTNFQLANGLYAKLYSQPLEMGDVSKTIISAETILELLKNNGGLKYDEDNLYINNDLLKKKDHYYIDTEQVGLWKCLQDTNISYNSSTYFINRSNEENASKLENLWESKIAYRIKPTETSYPALSSQDLIYKNNTVIGYIRLTRGTYSNMQVVYDIPGVVLFTRDDNINSSFSLVGTNGQNQGFRFLIDYAGVIRFDGSTMISDDTIIIPISFHVKSVNDFYLEKIS